MLYRLQVRHLSRIVSIRLSRLDLTKTKFKVLYRLQVRHPSRIL